LFRELQRINERPEVFSCLTTQALWTDPHISEQMLRFHLDGTIDLSSRRTESIETATQWMKTTFGLDHGARVLDLGCGPGLYTIRLARAGAHVTGVDFSARSIAHARAAARREGVGVTYVQDDYFSWDTDERFDLVTLIFCDYCPLAPHQRRALLDRVARWLAPDGAFLFDVCSVRGLEQRNESAMYAQSLMDGFWSPRPYFGFLNTFVYPEARVTLDRYEIVEEDGARTFYNWLQHFDPGSLRDELAASGFEVETLLGDVTGLPFDPNGPEFAVVARIARPS
jgi:SAM-dependent methyltransferase